MVGAAPGQFDPLAADLQRVVVAKGHLGHGPGRVIVADEKPASLLVPDPGHVVEQRGGPAVVGMVVGVNQVRHGVADALGGRDLVDSPAQVVPDAGRCVEQHHAVARGQERRLDTPSVTQNRFRSTRPTWYPCSLRAGPSAERGMGA